MTTSRATSYTHVERPTRVEPADLDLWLERGYFRMRQSMFSARFVHFEGSLRTAVWTRLPLDSFILRPSFAQRMRRNDRRFRVTHSPFVRDDRHEALYSRYLTVARGERSLTLADALLAESDDDAFQTRVIDVWDGDHLVAYSLFDEGHRTIQSVIGVYDPDYANRSLGIYTMLKEIEYGIARGLTHHYSGYVLPGEAAMSYKLDLGPLEAWDHDERRWMPYSERLQRGLDSDHMLRALVEAQDCLRRAGIDALLHSYPEFEGPAWSPDLANCLDQPMYLEIQRMNGPTRRLLVWDLVHRRYEIYYSVPAVGTFVPRGRSSRSVNLWMVQSRWLVPRGLDGLVETVRLPVPKVIG